MVLKDFTRKKKERKKERERERKIVFVDSVQRKPYNSLLIWDSVETFKEKGKENWTLQVARRK